MFETFDYEISRPNVRGKHDSLDLGRIPPGVYEMNYRFPLPPLARSLLESLPMLPVVCAAALFVPPIVRSVFHGPLAETHNLWHLALLSIGAFLVWLFLHLLVQLRTTPKAVSSAEVGAPAAEREITYLLATLAPLALLAAIAPPAEVVLPLLLFVVGLACLPILAHHLATHHVYWMSANPQNSLRLMNGWRKVWQALWQKDRKAQANRFLSKVEGPAAKKAIRVLRSYDPGCILGAICILNVLNALCIYAIAAAFPSCEHPFQVGLRSYVIFICVSTLYWCSRIPKGERQVFFSALWNWLCYPDPVKMPPWMFASPCGRLLFRRALMLGLLFCVAAGAYLVLGLSPLSQFCEWGLSHGPLHAVLRLALAAALLIALLTATFLGLLMVLMAPILGAWHELLEADGAPCHYRDIKPRQGYALRLAESANLYERRSYFVGLHFHRRYPVLLDIKVLSGHLVITGGTNTNKTHLGIAPLLHHLLLWRNCIPVVFDLKGDRALLHEFLITCALMGIIAKWLTLETNNATYSFNPCGQKHLKDLTVQQVCEIFCHGLDLMHGLEYGRGFFGRSARDRMFQAFNYRKNPRLASALARELPRGIQSFADLDLVMRRLAKTEKEYREASEIIFAIRSLAQVEQINLSPSRNPNEPAVKHAIQMADVIRLKQALYFYLPSQASVMTTSEIAKLALDCLNTAAMQHIASTGDRPFIVCFIDEYQRVVGENIQIFMEQARSNGIRLILAHQDRSQLRRPHLDFSAMMDANTAVKMHFAVRDRRTAEDISEMSGETLYAAYEWKQSFRNTRRGRIGPQYAIEDTLHVREMLGPCLSFQDIEDYSLHPNVCMINFSQAVGVTQYRGYVPVLLQWHITKAEFRRRLLKCRWPEKPGETTVVSATFGQTQEESRKTKPTTTEEPPAQDPAVAKQLQAIKQRQTNPTPETKKPPKPSQQS
jgi:hypothetical protein